jgi:hypothetical protein
MKQFKPGSPERVAADLRARAARWRAASKRYWNKQYTLDLFSGEPAKPPPDYAPNIPRTKPPEKGPE